MPTLVSSVPTAKAALQALLEAWPWPAGRNPSVQWGGPTKIEEFPKTGELIYFGDTTIDDTAPTLGETRRDEDYSLRVVIEVRRGGNNEQATETRAWELYSQVITLLDQNRTLSGTVNRMTDRTARQTNLPLPTDWLCRIVIDQGVVGLVYPT